MHPLSTIQVAANQVSTAQNQARTQKQGDCVLQEVGSDRSDEDDMPLAKLASRISWSDSDSDAPLSKLHNT